MNWRVEWKYVTKEIGEECVVTPGTILMPALFVDSWDIRALVSDIPGIDACS